jgi:glycosidase
MARMAASRITGSASSEAQPGSTTNQYASITCTCSRKQPDLNCEDPRLGAEIYQMMHWWL